ncbi:hypothetical protein EMPS_07537 [Entomortierella parvispora]|uniref:NAD-dependent epimerase/dehydratase domain-containing protein n=1 Tax=Entomortierella parvispora TaxID=205924 RepID=A0A9P3HEH3_9FUNG|nr:hypothetical protein EMPS_07537 [Entomortierella parvispora]
MVKILVIGAAGYFGLRVSQFLRRENHVVYGTTRSISKENLLLSNEIIPIVGPVESSDKHPAWLDVVKTENIDIVIDFSGIQNGIKVIVEPLIKLSKERQSDHRAKIGFIYCSGAWVLGSGYDLVNDLTPVGTKNSHRPPPSLVAWRPEVERQVLASYDHLNAVVIRPSLAYGGTADVWDYYFSQIYTAVQKESPELTLAADPHGALGLIHVDDVASGFLAAVEKLELVAGRKNGYPLFNLATSFESTQLILHRAASAMGYKGKVTVTGAPKGDGMPDIFLRAFNTTINADSSRARSVLGWKPTKTGMASGIEIYAKSWIGGHLLKQQAAKETKK